MALEFQIENSSGTVVYDFLTSGNLRIVDGSWRTQPSQDGRKVETMLLVSKDTPANIRADVGTLEDVLQDAISYHVDKYRDLSYWLRWVTDGESGKRALIYDYQLNPVPDSPDLPGGGITPNLEGEASYYELAITRHAAWEESAATIPVAGAQTVSGNGGIWNLTATNGGRLNGRISRFYCLPSSSGMEFTQFWAGMRLTRRGLSTFDPKYECEDASNRVDATDVADGSASGGDYVRVNFATDATLRPRLTFSVDQGSRDIDDMIGSYKVLLRYKTSDSTTETGVQLVSTFELPSTSAAVPLPPGNYGNIVYPPPNTTYSLLEIGVLEVSPFPIKMAEDIGLSVGGQRFSIFAERISGSGNLQLDSVILIPYEHYIAWDAGLVQYLEAAEVVTDEADRIQAFRNSTSVVDGVAEVSKNNWVYPREGGYFVVAAQRDSEHVLADNVGLHIEVFKRWQTYRV